MKYERLEDLSALTHWLLSAAFPSPSLVLHLPLLLPFSFLSPARSLCHTFFPSLFSPIALCPLFSLVRCLSVSFPSFLLFHVPTFLFLSSLPLILIFPSPIFPVSVFPTTSHSYVPLFPLLSSLLIPLFLTVPMPVSPFNLVPRPHFPIPCFPSRLVSLPASPFELNIICTNTFPSSSVIFKAYF